ncbi:hypothetical protein BYT27DRAFT_7187940 [Phlegmacium glaucopus]|nr:hypothetical protein BYT27DRAFT_7187940 [Phlegmacium glaucopus]
MSTERASKKCKTRSGCSGTELSSAFLILQKFRDSITTTEINLDDDILETVDSPELDTEIDQDALAQLDGLLQWMDSKMKFTTKSHTFSSIQWGVISGIQVSQGPLLYLKSDLQQRVADTRLTGANHFMSSPNLHRFLNMLLRLVARPSKASARTWVDAFLYRASAMLPDDKTMTLNVEYSVSPVTVPTASGVDIVLVGYMDYTVVVADPTMSDYFLNNARVRDLVRYIDSVLRFFVVKAKSGDVKLLDCLPQVFAQLYASARKLRKTHMRGALTNGYEWLFVVLTVNSDGGASYAVSTRSHSVAPQDVSGKMVLNEDQVDMIAGILASWIQHSCEDIGEDDWFRVGP